MKRRKNFLHLDKAKSTSLFKIKNDSYDKSNNYCNRRKNTDNGGGICCERGRYFPFHILAQFIFQAFMYTYTQCQTLFSGTPKLLQMVIAAMKLKRLLLGRKVMTNLDSILKNRDITLSTKVRLVKAMVFPVVMYGCESWTIKKAERRRIDAFELWC